MQGCFVCGKNGVTSIPAGRVCCSHAVEFYTGLVAAGVFQAERLRIIARHPHIKPPPENVEVDRKFLMDFVVPRPNPVYRAGTDVRVVCRRCQSPFFVPYRGPRQHRTLCSPCLSRAASHNRLRRNRLKGVIITGLPH